MDSGPAWTRKDTAGLVFLSLLALAFCLGWFSGATQAEAEPAPVQTDTLRLPPDPDFIEAFELDCRWVPRA